LIEVFKHSGFEDLTAPERPYWVFMMKFSIKKFNKNRLLITFVAVRK
jgi:hypothetical protein